MKPKKLVNILLGVIVLISTGPACIFTSSPAPSAQPSGQPSSQLSATSPAAVPERASGVLGDLGSISYTLDTARQVSDTFDLNSGEGLILTAADANGYGWMLSIPADALLTTTEIKMTPFATMDVTQSDARIISGVLLEPDGLQFVDAVRLSVTAPIDNPGVGLIFTFNQDGSGVGFAPTFNTSGGKTAIAQIWHFSSAGYDNSAHSGDDTKSAYRKMAEDDYRLALDAAKQFIRPGLPLLPFRPPSACSAAAPRSTRNKTRLMSICGNLWIHIPITLSCYWRRSGICNSSAV